MPSITGGLNGAPSGRFLDVSGWVGVPLEGVRYQELKLSITTSLALMIPAKLRYSATAVAHVAVYGTPGRVDMGNVG